MSDALDLSQFPDLPPEVVKAVSALQFELPVECADRMAIGKVARKVRTQVSRDVRVVYNVKARDVSSTVKILASKRGSVEERILLYTGGSIPLASFDAKPRRVRSNRGPRTGVTVKVRKDEG